MYANFNELMSQFKYCSMAVKLKLYESFCVNTYGIMLCNLDKANSTYVAWRKCTRRLLGVDPRTHSALLPYITGNDSLELRTRRQYLKFIQNCLTSDNLITRTVSHVALSNAPSITNSNVKSICTKHDLSFDDILKGKRVNIESVYDEELAQTGSLIRDFINLKACSHGDDKRNLEDILYELCVD